jgi:hypothetical protein
LAVSFWVLPSLNDDLLTVAMATQFEKRPSCTRICAEEHSADIDKIEEVFLQ